MFCRSWVGAIATMTLQSSEPLAMMLSLWGQNSMSRTGPVWPHTVG